ncbi:hypothetical protein LSH36_211g02023 [Paralvinella palmiformis]|uniref:Chitin-binding type-2 domain-containing protein n=1 Tax=Paralvinella palmiformis TaxID=53620 RepID=A0AAD9N475_9ANNE|nr:hypothetical protein LSH36_211g02023 [Paralvinella palmiformis]
MLTGSQPTLQCPDGMMWLDTVNGCVNLVSAAEMFSQIVPISCPKLYVFVQQDGQCRESIALSGKEGSANNEAPQCEEDFVWDPQMSMCIKKLSPDMFTSMKNIAKEGSDDAMFTLRGPVLRVTGGLTEAGSDQSMQWTNKKAESGMTASATNGMMYNGGMASSTYKVSSNGMSSSGKMLSSGAVSSNGLSLGIGQTGMVLTDMNGEPIHMNGQSDDTDTIPVSVEGNPCQSGEGFYHPYPADPRYFIQCDEFGSFFVHPCGYSLVWDQQLSTCIPWSVMLSAPDFGTDAKTDANMAGAAKEGPKQVTNPCADSEKTFFEFPYNTYLYIMCVGSQPYMMPCPAGLVWDNDVKTCVRT